MLILKLKVVPASGQQKIILDKNSMLKVYLKSVPENGKANQELIKLIAKTCNVTQHEVTIASGLTFAQKILHIQTNFSYEDFLLKAGITTVQTKLF